MMKFVELSATWVRRCVVPVVMEQDGWMKKACLVVTSVETRQLVVLSLLLMSPIIAMLILQHCPELMVYEIHLSQNLKEEEQ